MMTVWESKMICSHLKKKRIKRVVNYLHQNKNTNNYNVIDNIVNYKMNNNKSLNSGY